MGDEREVAPQVSQKLKINLDRWHLGRSDWGQQFNDAVAWPGEVSTYWSCGCRWWSADDDGWFALREQEASTFSVVMHVTNLPWKLFAALIPPTMCGPAGVPLPGCCAGRATHCCGFSFCRFYHGWIDVGAALVLIGLTTALIGDLASMFGCALGLEVGLAPAPLAAGFQTPCNRGARSNAVALQDSVTAITLVALGTSLPDTFASRTATLASKTADAAITNVTGSNSVNVRARARQRRGRGRPRGQVTCFPASRLSVA